MSTGDPKKYGSVDVIFVLCEICHWCATYFDKSRIPYNRCPICKSTALSTFPILPNEEFTFDLDEKHGVELEFGIRKGKDKGEGRQ